MTVTNFLEGALMGALVAGSLVLAAVVADAELGLSQPPIAEPEPVPARRPAVVVVVGECRTGEVYALARTEHGLRRIHPGDVNLANVVRIEYEVLHEETCKMVRD